MYCTVYTMLYMRFVHILYSVYCVVHDIDINIIDTYTQMLTLIYIPNCIYNNIITMYVTCIYINLFAQM